MLYAVDHIADAVSVLVAEDERVIQVKTDLLPKGTKEGDVLRKEQNTYIIDEVETEKARKRIQDLLDNLLQNKNKKTDE